MGCVYLVEHREIGKKFVAKVIHSVLVPDVKAVDRFRLEAQSLAQLDHPNIVEVKGTGATSDGRPFIVLEYLKGHTLSEELRRNKLEVKTALVYVEQALFALQAAHSAGIVHRDLKPGNIFITKDHLGAARVKVLDFGLAKVLPDAPTDAPSPLLDPTTMGNAIGTPSYMSPEQAMGRSSDERGDLYAAAVVLYKCLTGVGPFEHLGLSHQLEAHATATAEPPSRHAPGAIGRSLDAAVLRALSKDPEERFSSASEFRAALKKCAAARTSIPPGETVSEQVTTKRTVGLFVGAMGVTATLAAIVRLWMMP